MQHRGKLRHLPGRSNLTHPAQDTPNSYSFRHLRQHRHRYCRQQDRYSRWKPPVLLDYPGNPGPWFSNSCIFFSSSCFSINKFKIKTPCIGVLIIYLYRTLIIALQQYPRILLGFQNQTHWSLDQIQTAIRLPRNQSFDNQHDQGSWINMTRVHGSKYWEL